MRKLRNMKRNAVRLSALLLSLVMIVGALPGLTFSAFAAPDDARENGNKVGHTEHIIENSRIADYDTTDSYKDNLLSDENGSRYAGRIWTDKSVFAYNENGADDHSINLDMDTDGYEGSVDYNADFGHVFSALASSQVVNEYPPSPVDLVIVFDMSGSMGQDTRYGIDNGINQYVSGGDDYPATGVLMSDRIEHSRINTTLNAINNTIDKLMAQNPQNRVAVCGYGADAAVIMPLAHYRKVDDQPYLSVGGMETLYHPSDLVYRTVGDNFEGLPEVTEDGWYWMNNRDTCYTVKVNAQYNTYTGVLKDGKEEEGNKWDQLNKIVSNNVMSSNPNKSVKAFPGVAKPEEDVNNAENQAASKTVYNGAKNGGYGPKSQDLISAVANTKQLKADDYVGYFTNTQGGIYLAYKQLADSAATTYSEKLTNGQISTVARIPAAIIMSDGGANFAFNKFGETLEGWNYRYGRSYQNGSNDNTDPATLKDADGNRQDWYMNDNSWDEEEVSGEFQQPNDMKYRLNESTQVGDSWYNVYLPGEAF